MDIKELTIYLISSEDELVFRLFIFALFLLENSKDELLNEDKLVLDSALFVVERMLTEFFLSGSTILKMSAYICLSSKTSQLGKSLGILIYKNFRF